MSYKADLEILKLFARDIVGSYDMNDRCLISEVFTGVKDSLCKDGSISQKTFDNCYLSQDHYGRPCLYCGSYKVTV